MGQGDPRGKHQGGVTVSILFCQCQHQVQGPERGSFPARYISAMRTQTEYLEFAEQCDRLAKETKAERSLLCTSPIFARPTRHDPQPRSCT